jgi:hypothetical protein
VSNAAGGVGREPTVAAASLDIEADTHGGAPMADVRTVIAVTGEDDRYEPVRRAAIDRAREAHATLILYDIDAPTGPLESQTPTGWSAEGTEEDAADRLGPEELEAAGRGPISRQVAEARSQGVEAWGWLPSDNGRDALLEYASKQPGALVLAPQGDSDLDLGDLPEAELIGSGATTTR